MSFPADLAKKHTHFPFSYLYLHGPIDDVLTTIYLDANLNIRGTESLRLENQENNVMSQAQMMAIVKTLTEHNETLQQEYNDLLKKYKDLGGK